MSKRIQPKPGQESVWDYPRPPRIEETTQTIKIVFNGVVIAQTNRAKRILETSHPPVYSIPQEDVKMEYFTQTPRQTFCEFKGQASYWTIQVDEQIEENAAWSYPNPTNGFEKIANHISVYPSRMDACYVDEEKVQPQAGDFYGGWITSNIVGPFKGGPGTWGW